MATLHNLLSCLCSSVQPGGPVHDAQQMVALIRGMYDVNSLVAMTDTKFKPKVRCRVWRVRC